MTPGDIERLIVRTREEEARLVDALDLVRAQLIQLEAMLTESRRVHLPDSLLQKRVDSAIVNDTMEILQQVRGQRLRSTSRAAQRIRKVDGSIAQFAAKNGLAVTTVRSWYATGEAARDIPDAVRKRLSGKPYEIPETYWRPAAQRRAE